MIPETYYTTVSIVIIVMSSLSIIGGIIIILSYVILKQLRNFALKMVAYLCLSDLLSNVSMLIIPPNILHKNAGQYDYTILCTIQSFLQSWGDLSSMIWSVLISIVIFLTVVKRIKVENLKKKEYIFLIVGFLIPLLISAIPFLSDSYGEDTYYCWIQSDQSYDLTMKILINYAPLWISFIMITTLNCLTSNTIKKMEFLTADQQKTTKKMLLYPYILIITSFWSSIVALMEFSNQEIPEFLQILHHLFSRSLGLLNALMYGFTPVVRSKLRNYFSQNNPHNNQINAFLNKQFQDQDQFNSEGDDHPNNQEQQKSYLEEEDNLSVSSDGGDQFNAENAINTSLSDNDFLAKEIKKEKLHEILL